MRINTMHNLKFKLKLERHKAKLSWLLFKEQTSGIYFQKWEKAQEPIISINYKLVKYKKTHNIFLASLTNNWIKWYVYLSLILNPWTWTFSLLSLSAFWDSASLLML